MEVHPSTTVGQPKIEQESTPEMITIEEARKELFRAYGEAAVSVVTIDGRDIRGIDAFPAGTHIDDLPRTKAENEQGDTQDSRAPQQ